VKKRELSGEERPKLWLRHGAEERRRYQQTQNQDFNGQRNTKSPTARARGGRDSRHVTVNEAASEHGCRLPTVWLWVLLL
jgi:hypothetical protein